MNCIFHFLLFGIFSTGSNGITLLYLFVFLLFFIFMIVFVCTCMFHFSATVVRHLELCERVSHRMRAWCRSDVIPLASQRQYINKHLRRIRRLNSQRIRHEVILWIPWSARVLHERSWSRLWLRRKPIVRRNSVCSAFLVRWVPRWFVCNAERTSRCT